MPTADTPRRRPSKVVELVWDMLFGALLFGLLWALMSLFTGNSVLGEAVSGAAIGALLGVVWFWDSRRTEVYRSAFDPTTQTLTRPTSTATDLPRLERTRTRRYRQRVLVAIAALSSIAFLTVAVLATRAADAPAIVKIFFWCMALFCGSFLGVAWLTYTEVGHGGLRVRTPTRLETIRWPELAKVRWRRDAREDLLLLCTNDGREIKAAGVAVAGTGRGKRQAARMLADIEQTWAQLP